MSSKLSGKEIRQKFLDFFEKKHNHILMKSSSLIPDNPTLLLTSAGMVQFIPMYLGYVEPPNPPRITTVQKCARAGGKDSDIENVGRTPRHHTFFEMLGNFAFGDYFKEEIIPWAWEFVTQDLNLDKSRLWITIYETDDESFEIWNKKVGVPQDRIIRKGKKDNFWGPVGTEGSCGPCTEIHYDLGEEYSCGHPNCGIDTCECDRFVEIWNLVFTELYQDEQGNLSPLEKKNVDTGMGLERITMVCNDKSSTFETDLLLPILNKVCEISGKKYNENEKTNISLRIITDHIRCVSFMIADGLVPSNEGRNYVLRMILRRALRHGRILGINDIFLYKIVDTVVNIYGEIYPELVENKDKIINEITKEEKRFLQTLEKGQNILDELIEKAKQNSSKISGEDAFKLYDTFGFPLELTIEIALENGISVDKEGFETEMKEQKKRAKEARKKINLTDDLVYTNMAKTLGKTDFCGYNLEECECNVLEIIQEDENIEVILDQTPFYAESGGQVADEGILTINNNIVEVFDVQKFDNMFVHKLKTTCPIEKGEKIKAKIDTTRRKKIAAHHSLAHLLQAALIQVVGDEVKQAGSYVDESRMRFDFSYEKAMTPCQIEQVEQIINEWIFQGLDVKTSIMDLEEAQKTGAMALFGEKYEDKVRVVSIGDISKELCGGTHVKNTEQIGIVKILSESAIAAGTRRIEAVSNLSALEYLNEKAQEFDKIANTFKAPTNEVFERFEKTITENKELSKKVKELETKLALLNVEAILDNAKDFEDGKLIITKVENVNAEGLKNIIEKISDKYPSSIIVLAGTVEDKITIMSKISENFVKKGFQAGKIVNEIASKCEGKGGGRPNFAQAGAKNKANLDEALSEFEKTLI